MRDYGNVHKVRMRMRGEGGHDASDDANDHGIMEPTGFQRKGNRRHERTSTQKASKRDRNESS